MSRFAVLLCTHNGDTYLGPLLDSVLAQTHAPVALFIHDWGSSDGTRLLLESFAKRAESRFQVDLVLHDEAPGARESFFSGIRACLQSSVPFEFLALCDQDDIWHADKLARYAAVAGEMAGSGPLLLCSDVRLIDGKGAEIGPSFYGPGSVFRPPANGYDPGLLLANPIIGMTMAIPRAMLKACEPRLAGPWLMHDWALLLLAAAHNCSLRYVDAPLVSYRQHGSNVLGAAHGLRLRARWDRARTHFARLRAQCGLLREADADALGVPARRLTERHPLDRWTAARVAVTSRLFRPHARVLLAAAILVFW